MTSTIELNAIKPSHLFKNIALNYKPIAVKLSHYSDKDSKFIKDEVTKLLNKKYYWKKYVTMACPGISYKNQEPQKTHGNRLLPNN